MRESDVRTALCEHHRRELLAEAERQRLVHSLPRHQRHMGILARAAQVGWTMLRNLVGKGNPIAVSGDEDRMQMVVRYYPANDWDVNRLN